MQLHDCVKEMMDERPQEFSPAAKVVISFLMLDMKYIELAKCEVTGSAVLKQITPLGLRDYAMRHGWNIVYDLPEVHWGLSYPEGNLDMITVAISTEFADYATRVKMAIVEIAKQRKLSQLEVLLEILHEQSRSG